MSNEEEIRQCLFEKLQGDADLVSWADYQPEEEDEIYIRTHTGKVYSILVEEVPQGLFTFTS